MGFAWHIILRYQVKDEGQVFIGVLLLPYPQSCFIVTLLVHQEFLFGLRREICVPYYAIRLDFLPINLAFLNLPVPLVFVFVVILPFHFFIIRN